MPKFQLDGMIQVPGVKNGVRGVRIYVAKLTYTTRLGLDAGVLEGIRQGLNASFLPGGVNEMTIEGCVPNISQLRATSPTMHPLTVKMPMFEVNSDEPNKAKRFKLDSIEEVVFIRTFK